MSLAIWDPFCAMEELVDRYNRSARKSLVKYDDKSFEIGDWMPTVDISETDDAFVVKAELPGVDKDDVSVKIENGILTIRGEKKTETEDKDNSIVSPIPGKVVKIFVKPGQKVKVGDTIIIISAMKMDSEFKTKKDGIVKKINVKEGDTVKGGKKLVIIKIHPKINKNEIL